MSAPWKMADSRAAPGNTQDDPGEPSGTRKQGSDYKNPP